MPGRNFRFKSKISDCWFKPQVLGQAVMLQQTIRTQYSYQVHLPEEETEARREGTCQRSSQNQGLASLGSEPRAPGSRLLTTTLSSYDFHQPYEKLTLRGEVMLSKSHMWLMEGLKSLSLTQAQLIIPMLDFDCLVLVRLPGQNQRLQPHTLLCSDSQQGPSTPPLQSPARTWQMKVIFSATSLIFVFEDST